jgi:hypothetical protein
MEHRSCKRPCVSVESTFCVVQYNAACLPSYMFGLCTQRAAYQQLAGKTKRYVLKKLSIHVCGLYAGLQFDRSGIEPMVTDRVLQSSGGDREGGVQRSMPNRSRQFNVRIESPDASFRED